MAPAVSKQELPPWGNALAGSAGALVANALVYPLDVVKTRLQVQVKRNAKDTHTDAADHVHYDGTMHAIRHIVDDEGISGLFTGISGSLLGVVSTNFAYFYCYSLVRTMYQTRISKNDKPASTLVELSMGAVAGALAQIFTIPISVVTTRQQTQLKGEKKGMFETAKEIVDGPEGVAGLWRGIKASMVLVVNPSITYGAYARLQTLLFPNKLKLAAHEAFLLGSLSKMMATMATQPLIISKVALQSKPPPARNGKPFEGFVDVMRYIVEREGLLGLYKGVAPQLLKGFLVQGILMMTKERVELLFILLFRYVRQLRKEQLEKLAKLATEKASEAKQVVAQKIEQKV